MYFSAYETDPACVPYLSDSYIDSYCNDLIFRFDPTLRTRPHPVNINDFIRRFMGLNIEYENLTSDGSILGATLFIDTDRFPVYDEAHNRAVYRSAKAGTVFADKSLLSAGKLNRYRFTMAHEAGHQIWHGMYYRAKVKAAGLRKAYLSCSVSGLKLKRSDRLLTEADYRDLLEYQANRTASALLMPKDCVLAIRDEFSADLTGDEIEDLVIYIAGTFRVSDASARRRLEDLGIVKKRRIA